MDVPRSPDESRSNGAPAPGSIPGDPAAGEAAAASGRPSRHRSARSNWLRAGVLGANDGIVSTAALVVGVAAADSANTAVIATAGLAGLLAGAASMALGEYVSVSTQRDMERAIIAEESDELATEPEAELAELVDMYRRQGLSEATARLVSDEMTRHDALGAHLRLEAGIDRHELTNPWQAAGASGFAFLTGALLPIAAILLTPGGPWRIPVTFVAVIAALLITGFTSATLGRSPRVRAMTRVVVGGALAMTLTWAIGNVVGLRA